MSKRFDTVTLIDIQQAIDAILEYSAGYDYDAFVADRRTCDAVYRNFEIMGEAANRLTEGYLQLHDEIPWNKMIATRNALIHGYDEINDRIIWNIVQNILPDLKIQIDKLIQM